LDLPLACGGEEKHVEESKMSNHGKEHGEKMCAMTCCPCNLNLEEIKALVRSPKFICKSCGRVAEKSDNLCQPEPLG
jgi:hypothetical protein